MKMKKELLKELNERIFKLALQSKITTDSEKKAKLNGEIDGILFTIRTLFNKEEVIKYKPNENGDGIMHKSFDYILKQ